MSKKTKYLAVIARISEAAHSTVLYDDGTKLALDEFYEYCKTRKNVAWATLLDGATGEVVATYCTKTKKVTLVPEATSPIPDSTNSVFLGALLESIYKKHVQVLEDHVKNSKKIMGEFLDKELREVVESFEGVNIPVLDENEVRSEDRPPYNVEAKVISGKYPLIEAMKHIGNWMTLLYNREKGFEALAKLINKSIYEEGQIMPEPTRVEKEKIDTMAVLDHLRKIAKNFNDY